ncbi:MAG: DUF1801 domain-containing protein [Bacteroidia bacterium]
MATPLEYIEQQLPERQEVLRALHGIIQENDASITPVVEPMMGKEMIIYKAHGMMKYALSSVKAYISLHVLPMYGSAAIHARYVALLPDAQFQKGCINFKEPSQLPLAVAEALIRDCAPIDLKKLREEQLQSRKKAK